MSIGPGTRLGAYVVQEFIGQGAMGVVYRAYHAELERVAAVKVLQGLATDGDSSARFRREAQAIAHMRHPNVLNVFDFGEFEGTPYMIVEYVEGGSLSARLKRSPIDQESALRYLQGIGEALDYAHSHGIVHRDVKPANVLLGPEDAPILADFGLVKLMESSSIASLTGVTTGTPAYMAPEQVTGKHVGPAADRYAFAVMAYEMLTGEFPFQGEGVLEVLYAHVHKAPPAPSTRNESVGPRADAVILRGLAKDPNARWESCESLVAALTAALQSPASGADKTIVMRPPIPASSPVAVATAPTANAPVLARTAVIDAGAAATAAKTKPQAPAAADATVFAPLTQPEDKRRRRRTLFAIGAALLILLLLAGGVFVFEATLPPTLDVSPKVATFGEPVVVTATHVPRDQTGEIRLESVLHTFPFRADNSGKVSAEIAVPYDIATGEHFLRICWTGQCRAQTTLRVVAGVAEVSPLPGGSPTSSPSSSPSPGSSPTSRPTSSTSPRPNSSPTSSPAPSPKPSPTPPPPSPTPSCWTSGPYLTESPNPVLAGASVTVSGMHFKPGPITLSYQAGNGAFVSAGTATAGSNCTFSKAVATALIGGLLTSRTDTVKACDSAGRCAYVSFKAQTLL